MQVQGAPLQCKQRPLHHLALYRADIIVTSCFGASAHCWFVILIVLMASESGESRRNSARGSDKDEFKVIVDQAFLILHSLPLDYKGCKCRLCGHTSVEMSPLNEDVKGANEKFWPLWPWYKGTKECPKGFFCLSLVCTMV